MGLFDLRRLLGLDHPQQPQRKPVVGRGYGDTGSSIGLPSPSHPYGLPLQNSQHPLQVQPQHSPANLGVPYSQAQDAGLGQGGAFGPGFTPLQNSGFGPQGNPQQGAWPNPYPQGGGNPQDNKRQQYWLY